MVSQKDSFFYVPDQITETDASKSDGKIKDKSNVKKDHSTPLKNMFIHADLNGDPISEQTESGDIKGDSSTAGVPGHLSEKEILKLQHLLSAEDAVHIQGTVMATHSATAVIRFQAIQKNIFCDVRVPLDITANDFIMGLSEAYGLGIDSNDIEQCYLSCESPIALLRGKHLLGEYGIRDGSLITYTR